MSSSAFPRIRPDLRFVAQVQEGVSVFVVKDPVTQKYFRFGRTEGLLMREMDGTRTPSEIAARMRAELGLAISPSSVETFHRRLQELGLAERGREERSVLIMEAVRRQRHERIRGAGDTIFRMRFSFGDPDALLTALARRVRFFWTPAFVAFSVVLFAVYALILTARWDSVSAGLGMMYRPAEYTFGFVLTLYLVLVAVTIVHEFGHGLTCKHFGGEVREMGAMLLYFSPAMYCNVNDAWTFERKSHRLWVTFAGGWIELVVAALASTVWFLTEPGTGVHQVAFITMITGGTLALLLNFNPLIPLDGYFALMDWVEIPNLRARSFEYLGAVSRRRFLRLDVTVPVVTPRERRIFLTYATLSMLYVTLLLLLLGAWLANLLIGWFGGWGWTIVAFAVWSILRRRFAGMARVASVWTSDAGAGGVRRTSLFAAAAAVSILVLSLVVPWDVKVVGPALIEPAERVWLRPADAGWVQEVRLAEGGRAEAGDTVAVLRNVELDLARSRLVSEVGRMEREVAVAHAAYGGLARQFELQLEAARLQLAEVENRRDALVLRAPVAGHLVTPRPGELVGSHIERGDSLLELWVDGPLQVRLRLPEREAGRVAVGSLVRMRFPARPDLTWRTRVEEVGAAVVERRVEALVTLPADGGVGGFPLRPGMSGTARVVVRETHVAGALLDGFLHTLRLDWLL
jgi:putative peptide zinc metalloprotease protein